jgi:hypothetical protein
LVIGIIAGTYSSIYISAALALDFGLRTDDLLERKLDQAGRGRRPAVQRGAAVSATRRLAVRLNGTPRRLPSATGINTVIP